LRATCSELASRKAFLRSMSFLSFLYPFIQTQDVT
jgi:hypothetical protein